MEAKACCTSIFVGGTKGLIGSLEVEVLGVGEGEAVAALALSLKSTSK